jgi:pSer/pThr/pTyr-binding forkhead associated (FHA) protein
MAIPIAQLIATEETANSFPQYKVIDVKPGGENVGNIDEFWIGRHPDVHLLLADVTVSRKHACLKYCKDKWMILDNKSSNGVMLNGIFITQGVYMDAKQDDIIAIVNATNNFEWKLRISFGEPEKNITESIFLEELNVLEKQNLLVSKMKQEKLNLEKKSIEIDKETKLLNEQKEKIAKLLNDEKEEFSKKQAKEYAKFEIEVKAEKDEVIENQRTAFDQRLKDERKRADERSAAKKHSFTKSIADAECRLNKLATEKDDIVISLEFEMEKNKEEVGRMKVNFESRLRQLSYDCENEKAAAQEHKSAVKDLKKNFDSILKHNKMEMEQTVEVLRLDTEKEKQQKEGMKQELVERDEEIAILKQELNVQQNCSDVLKLLSKCNEELKCSICNELFIEPMSLGCGHVYCKHCLKQWEENCGNCFGKFNCPNCREPISQFNKSLHLENLISSVYSDLGKSLQKEREDLIKDRKVEELASEERQVSEKRQREQEQMERNRRRRRGRQTQNESIESRQVRVAMRASLREQQTIQRRSVAESGRNLQESVSRILQRNERRVRLAATELPSRNTSETASTTNSGIRVAQTVNAIRQRLITEMATRRNGTRQSVNEDAEILPSEGREGIIVVNLGSPIIPINHSDAPPVIDLVTATHASTIMPMIPSNTDELTGENDVTDDVDRPRSTEASINRLSSQSSNSSESSNTRSRSASRNRISSHSSNSSESSNTRSRAPARNRSSSQSSNSSESSNTSSDFSQESSGFMTDASSDASIEGISGFIYGGYGECYKCGRRGHWAPGCPL